MQVKDSGRFQESQSSMSGDKGQLDNQSHNHR